MKKHIAAILAAGCFWGLMGLFSREMAAVGFNSQGTLIVRCSIACVCFGITLLITDKSQFKVKLRHLWCFLGAGVCSLLFFSYSYYQCISMTSLSTAAILLYTAPSIVMLLSLVIFKERLTKKKVLALVMAFVGCGLVSGIGGGGDVTPLGIFYGLCAGLGYALYSIFARLALNRGYGSNTINFYATLFGFLGACVIWGGVEPIKLVFAGGMNILWSLGTGVISCFLPYLLYTYGMTGVETGKASVMASLEPVVATVTGVLVYNESLSLTSFAGIVLVLGAIVVLNMKKKEAAA